MSRQRLGKWVIAGRGLAFCLGAMAGLLLWSRLKIVTASPRTAYAEPQLVENGADPVPAASTRTGAAASEASENPAGP